MEDNIVKPNQIEEPIAPVTPVTAPEPTTPVAPVTPTPSIDTSSIEKNVSEKVSKSVIEKIGEALGLNKKEEAKIPTDPEELKRFVEENSKKTVEQILGDKQKQEQEVIQKREKELEEGSKRYQSLWTNQFEHLVSLGKVPKIEDSNNKDDAGRQAKTKLLTKLYEVIQENEKNGIDEVPTLKEIYYEYPEVLKNTVAGGNTPISGGGRSHVSGGSNYNDIHNSSFEDILRNS